jgi:hypothetical protein
LITDCDEVLLHFMTPFHGWAGDTHDIEFEFERHDFFNGFRYRTGGGTVTREKGWAIFNQFFTDEMHRQPMVPGAAGALSAVAAHADVVVLTNLPHDYQQLRTDQLLGHGIPYRVACNQGPKGPALKALLDEFQPTAAVFVDDLAEHHASVAEIAPEVKRLHMIAEPRLAPHIPPAPAAHARIDDWAEALPWIMEQLQLHTFAAERGS